MPQIPASGPSEALPGLLRVREPMPATEHARVLRPRPPTEGLTSLDAVLAGRRAVYDLASRPVALPDLTRVLDLAEHTQREQWPVERHGDAGLRVLLAAYTVTGLDPGLYHRHQDDGGITRLETPPWLADLPARYTDAPVLALVCGAVARASCRSYGGLLVRAGALGYAVWLAARSYGMDCSVFGRASEPTAAAQDLEPGSRHLFTVAVGHTAADGGQGRP